MYQYVTNTKMKRYLIRFLVFGLSIVCIFQNMMVTRIGAEENNGAANNLVVQPKDITYGESVLHLSDEVYLKADTADEDAVRELKAFLEGNGISVIDTEKADATTIWLAESDDSVSGLDAVRNNMGLQDATDLKQEGYVLGVSNALTANGDIVIIGKDEDGTFYGVQTLIQLAQGKDISEVVISDEPTMASRGSIEGFYAHVNKGGAEWTWEQRKDQVRFYGKTKMNTYIFAPKDDPYHRAKWREDYPEADMKQIIETAAIAKQNKVDFVFALSPGNDIALTGTNAEADYQTLVKKCNKMYDGGVRSFAIFFDDITLRTGAGTQQSEFLNRFNEEFVKAKGDVTPLVTVPTQYDTNAMRDGDNFKEYTIAFSENIDEDIVVLWTGPSTVPDGISVSDTELIKTLYGDSLGIWWNYPCNDYQLAKLGLGPIYGLDNELGDMLDYFVMNPMGHADLSKITLATGADYAWNTKTYDDKRSFNNAINYLYGDLAPYMYTFANHSTRLAGASFSSGREDAQEIRDLMDVVIAKVGSDIDLTNDADIIALRAEFDKMQTSADVLLEAFDADQLSHAKPYLEKLKALGKNGDCVKVGTALLADDMVKMVKFYNETLGFQAEWLGDDFAEIKTASGYLALWLYSRKEFVKTFNEPYIPSKGINQSFEIAFWLPTYEDVDIEYERLSKLDVPFPAGEPTTYPFGIR
ncbi:beta-N-acetylglucosaminidase domain-containing protein, partial [Breznakia sp. OttesenSCG-928-G09]|nr:beta-N-acetylglucosaminidase domain-containing protein [Breznakia sp. OttesenSCG-928-G09]